MRPQSRYSHSAEVSVRHISYYCSHILEVVHQREMIGYRKNSINRTLYYVVKNYPPEKRGRKTKQKHSCSAPLRDKKKKKKVQDLIKGGNSKNIAYGPII